MTYSKAFQNALNQGEVVVFKTWTGRTGKIAVQFMQQIDAPSGGINKFVAIGLGIKNAGKQRVSAILNLIPEVAASFGLVTDTEYFNSDTVILAKDLFGDCEIQVTENTTPNEYLSNPRPKINPITGEILCVKGMPIYRHTELVEKGQAINTFLAHDSVIDEEGEILESEGQALESNV